jgi:hypothetical protein
MIPTIAPKIVPKKLTENTIAIFKYILTTSHKNAP